MPSKLQDVIAQQRPGQSLILDPPNQEFEGPVVLNQPLVLQGQGATIRARKGPLLTVATTGVQLRNLNLEITGERKRLNEQEACALLVKSGISLTIKDCFVRGDVSGVAGEEGRWIYPRSIRLGKLTPQRVHRFLLRLALPCPCEILCEIDGLTVTPKRSSGGGPVHVTLELEALRQHIRIRGNLTIKTASFSRLIAITGNASAGDDALQVVEGDGQLIYDCQDPKAADRCNAAQTVRPAQEESSADLATSVITPPLDASSTESTTGATQTNADSPEPPPASTRRPPTRSVPGTDLWSEGTSTPLKEAVPASGPGPVPSVNELPASPAAEPLPPAFEVPEPARRAEGDSEEPSRKKPSSPRVKSVPLTNLWSPKARDEQPEIRQQPPTQPSSAPTATDIDRAGHPAADSSADPPATAGPKEPERPEPPKKPSQRTRMSVPVSGVFGAAPTPTVPSEPPSATPSPVAEQPTGQPSEPSAGETAESVGTAASDTAERPKKPKIVKSANVGVFGKVLEDH